MSYGLPVIGSTFGSLPELIPEFAGILCQNKTELADHVLSRPRQFKSKDIADYARSQFNSKKMAEHYISYYEKVLKKERFNQSSPTWAHSKAPTIPLYF